jgi:hypothetical protein
MSTSSDTSNSESVKTVDDNGVEKWLLDGKLHRRGGPAAIYPDGREEWWYHGIFNRVDGPRIKTGNVEIWYKDHKMHRLNAPAVLYPSGEKEWWVDGKRHRVDGPAIIKPNGTKEWWVKGSRHRDDGPAIVRANGIQFWYKRGLLHREDGPAVVGTDGSFQWCVDGKSLSTQAYKETVTILAGELCDVTSEELKTLPFSQIESLVYSFNGWKLS